MMSLGTTALLKKGAQGDTSQGHRPSSGSLERVAVNEEEAMALSHMRAAMSPDCERAARHALVEGERLESCLSRFLHAKHLRVGPALKLLAADIQWRREVQPARMAERPPEEVAGCRKATLQENMPSWLQGFDRQGRPLIFSHYGRFRFRLFLEETSVDNMIQLQIHNSERAARICGLQSIRLNRNISSVCSVIDAEGCDPSNFTTRHIYTWARAISKIEEQHYPGRLGVMIIINAPSVVHRFWKVVQSFLPADMRSKVHLYAGREQWAPELLELVEPDQLPPRYGGSAAHRGDLGIPLSLPR